MHHFVNVTFQVPTEHLHAFMHEMHNPPPNTYGIKVVKVEEMGTDQMPDRCEKTPDLFEGERKI
jgi:hypothetical protein